MKGEQVVNLYRLVGETQVGELIVASTKVETLMLWHRCLGYMS